MTIYGATVQAQDSTGLEQSITSSGLVRISLSSSVRHFVADSSLAGGHTLSRIHYLASRMAYV